MQYKLYLLEILSYYEQMSPSFIQIIKRSLCYITSSALAVYAGYDGSVVFGLVTFIGALLVFDAADLSHLPFFNKMFHKTQSKDINIKRPFWWFLLILIAFRTFLFDVMYVPSGSMTPTLLTGDFVLVKKAEFGFNKESLWPLGKLLPYLPTYSWHKPSRGEIVVWTRAHDPATVFYVKRAVGVGLDTIEMKQGNLHINGHPSLLTYKGASTMLNDNGQDKMVQIYQEQTFNTKTLKLIVRDMTFGQAHSDNTALTHIPADHFAIVGDNRTNYGSHDSRDLLEFPPMPYDQIIGKPKLVLFSTTSWKHYPKDVTWGTWLMQLPIRFLATFMYLRTDRFLKIVE